MQTQTVCVLVALALALDGDGRSDLAASGTHVNNQATIWGFSSGPHRRRYRNTSTMARCSRQSPTAAWASQPAAKPDVLRE